MSYNRTVMKNRPALRLMLIVFILSSFVGCSRSCPNQGPGPAIGDTPISGVILISLDTLRADRLGCYGNPRQVSPFLDGFAARSVRFANAFSAAPRTAPSHMTMFTGLYPAEHKVHFGYNTKTGEVKIYGLSSGVTTLAQRLKREGFRTAAFTGGGELAAEAGFDRGFDIYKEGGRQLTPENLEPVKEWLTAAGSDKFFLFLHTYQIHDPYLPPPPYNARFDPDYQGWVRDSTEFIARSGGADYHAASTAFWQKGPNNQIDPGKFSDADLHHLLALYDGNIAYVDDQLKKFFAWAEQQPWWVRTMVIITSDHGEEFLEHGYFLHRTLYTETLRVPLIVRYPGVTPAVIEEPFSLVRLSDLVLMAPPLACSPYCLESENVPVLQGRKPGGKSSGLCYSQEPWLHGWPHESVRDGRWTLYVKGLQPENVELYDRQADPSEQDNLAAANPAQVQRLRKIIGAFTPPAPKQDPDAPGLRSDGKPRPELGASVPVGPVRIIKIPGSVPAGDEELHPPAIAPPADAAPDRVNKLKSLGYIQ